ncbi:MAG: phosphate acyltransferase [Clostridia bacterium]|nr:phosphate acyltransferase [Clostridia bacterium]
MFSAKNLIKKAQKKDKTLVFPEAGFCDRIVQAARIVHKKKIAKVILLGDESALILRYKDKIKGMTIINPKTSDIYKELVELLLEKRKEKGLVREEAEKLTLDPLYFGVLLVEAGLVDGMVAGAKSSSPNVIRPALQIIKTKIKGEIASSLMIFYGKNKMLGKNRVMFGADVGLNINPTEDKVVQIAKQTACSFEKITEKKAHVAMLSYSTNGSASGESVDKIKNATEKLKKDVSLIVDGEMQLDTALSPRVADIKNPDSVIKGDANVLIFPDLNSGNICYKAIQYFGNVKVIGPILQNLRKPVNDLSRGATVEDIVTVSALTVLQAE